MAFDSYQNYSTVSLDVVDQIVCKLKSQGIFDKFRKDCLADVDTKPAYQNLQQRVNGTVASFLAKHKWTQDLNKNQLRENLRRHVQKGYLEVGVDRIVDQVVNPRICPVLLPCVEDLVYDQLGIEKPKATVKKEDDKGKLQNASTSYAKPKNPDPAPIEVEKKPPEVKEEPPAAKEENSNDSRLSGISELTSHESIKDISESAQTLDKARFEVSCDSMAGRKFQPEPEREYDNFSNLKEKLAKADIVLKTYASDEDSPPPITSPLRPINSEDELQIKSGDEYSNQNGDKKLVSPVKKVDESSNVSGKFLSEDSKSSDASKQRKSEHSRSRHEKLERKSHSSDRRHSEHRSRDKREDSKSKSRKDDSKDRKKSSDPRSEKRHEDRSKHREKDDKSVKSDKDKRLESSSKKDRERHSSTSEKKSERRDKDRSSDKHRSSRDSKSRDDKRSDSKHRRDKDKEKDRKRKGERCKDEVKSKESRRSSDRDSSGRGGSKNPEGKSSEPRSKDSEASSTEKNSTESMECDRGQHDDIDAILAKLKFSVLQDCEATGEPLEGVEGILSPMKKPRFAKNVFEVRKMMASRKLDRKSNDPKVPSKEKTVNENVDPNLTEAPQVSYLEEENLNGLRRPKPSTEESADLDCDRDLESVGGEGPPESESGSVEDPAVQAPSCDVSTSQEDSVEPDTPSTEMERNVGSNEASTSEVCSPDVSTQDEAQQGVDDALLSRPVREVDCNAVSVKELVNEVSEVAEAQGADETPAKVECQPEPEAVTPEVDSSRESPKTNRVTTRQSSLESKEGAEDTQPRGPEPLDQKPPQESEEEPRRGRRRKASVNHLETPKEKKNEDTDNSEDEAPRLRKTSIREPATKKPRGRPTKRKSTSRPSSPEKRARSPESSDEDFLGFTDKEIESSQARLRSLQEERKLLGDDLLNSIFSLPKVALDRNLNPIEGSLKRASILFNAEDAPLTGSKTSSDMVQSKLKMVCAIYKDHPQAPNEEAENKSEKSAFSAPPSRKGVKRTLESPPELGPRVRRISSRLENYDINTRLSAIQNRRAQQKSPAAPLKRPREKKS